MVFNLFSQALYESVSWAKDPTQHAHTCLSAAMADMQMKILRKKIQKRNDKNKQRKLLRVQKEEEDNGEGDFYL